MFRKRLLSLFVFPALMVVMTQALAGAQLASRPAEEWKNTLDQPSRVEALKINEIVTRLGLRPNLVVADLGAGTGIFTVPMARAVSPGGKVYAVEIDKGFFPIIEGKAKENKLANIQTVVGQFKDPSLPAKDVDVAFMHDVLHHVEDRAGYLKTTVSYLKLTGRFVVVDYKADQSPHRDQPALIVSEAQVTEWMRSAGLNKVEKMDLFPDKYFLIFSR